MRQCYQRNGTKVSDTSSNVTKRNVLKGLDIFGGWIGYTIQYSTSSLCKFGFKAGSNNGSFKIYSNDEQFFQGFVAPETFILFSLNSGFSVLLLFPLNSPVVESVG